MNLSAASVTALSSAKSPEEAAKIFYAEASRGLSIVIANAVEKAINSANPASANSMIAGWEKLVGGCGIQLAWESPSILKSLPLTQISCFAPYAPSMPINTMNIGVGVSVGISITGSF
jgi:hypothetical protein